MRRIALTSMAAFAVTVGGSAAVTPPAGSWLAPVALSSPSRNATAPLVGVDRAGDTIVVWIDVGASRQVLLARIRPAGGRFGPPGRLAAGDSIGMLHLAVNDRGDAVAVWTLAESGAGRLQAAFRPAGGRFGSVEKVASPGGSPDVGIDGRGNAFAVWAAGSFGSSDVLVARRPYGGRFGPAQTLGSGDSPVIGVGADGEAIAAWLSGSGFGGRVVRAAIRPAGGAAFGPPRDVSKPSDIPCCISIDMNARGDAAVAWPAYTHGSVAELRAALRPAGGAFGGEETIGGPVSTVAALSVDERGGVTAAWLDDDYVLFPLFAAYRPPGATFGPAKQLSPDAGSVALASDRSGSGLIVWSRFAGDYVVQAATMRNGTYGPVRDLSTHGYNSAPATVALDGSGDGVAVWPRSNGGTFFVELSAYDAAGPRLGALHIPNRARIGKKVRLSVAPLDVWSRVAATRWSFGDGGRESGRQVSHAYMRPGRYVVRVTSTDAVRHSTTASRTIVVGRGS